jgi:hypothetical protein
MNSVNSPNENEDQYQQDEDQYEENQTNTTTL